MNTIITNNLSILLLIIVLIASSLTDIRTRLIPNIITLPSILIAFSYFTLTSGIDGLLFSLTGLAAGIGLLILPYIMGGMGAGDTKLMGVVGAYLGAEGVFITFLLAALLGGIYAFFTVVVKRKYFKGFFRNQIEVLKALVLTRKFIPDAVADKKGRPRLCYGPAIALGSFIYIALDVTGYQFPI